MLLLLFFLQYFTCNALSGEWMQDFVNATEFIDFLLCIPTSKYKLFLPVHNTISILIHKWNVLNLVLISREQESVRLCDPCKCWGSTTPNVAPGFS